MQGRRKEKLKSIFYKNAIYTDLEPCNFLQFMKGKNRHEICALVPHSALLLNTADLVSVYKKKKKIHRIVKAALGEFCGKQMKNLCVDCAALQAFQPTHPEHSSSEVYRSIRRDATEREASAVLIRGM